MMLERLKQVILVEIGAPAHSPVIKAAPPERLLVPGPALDTGCTGMGKTRSLTLDSSSKWQRLMG